MFKLIASDLDGTLLDSNKKISPYSCAVLKQAYEQGYEFIICTGRMYDSLKHILPDIPFCRYAIVNMGADIYDNFTHEHIYSRPLEEEYAHVLVDYAIEHSIHMQVYIDNVLYVNCLDKYSDQYFADTGSASHKIEGDMHEFIRGRKISKMIFIGEPEDIAVHDARVREMLGGKINICASSKTYVECSSLTAQKHIALNYLVEKLGHTRDELIVFGDSGNDVAMLENTGFPVCVGNGWEEAKRVSKLIVESNDNDGVAKTIKRLMLKEI